MANPTCTIAALNSACFDGMVLDNLTRKALTVWLRAAELKGIGGTDYTTKLTSVASGGLLGDTNSLFGTSNYDELETFKLSIQQNAAVASGGTTSQTINNLIQNIKCLENVNGDTLDKMLVLLQCRLGVHKSYTQ